MQDAVRRHDALVRAAIVAEGGALTPGAAIALALDVP
jgi:hypothetical protein